MFQLQARGSTWPRELLAGITVFFTASYILFLIPPLLQKAGLPADHGAALVALVAGVGTIAMGLFANLPFILAPGMGMAAYFVFGGVFDMGLTWQAVLTGAFVASLTIAVLTLLGLRDFLVDAFPTSVKLAAMSGVGLFLTFIGFQNAGLVVDSPATLVTLGSMKSPSVLLTFFGIIFTGVLMVRRVPAAIVAGLLFLGAMFCVPLLGAIPAIATAPALIITGAMMMRGITDMEWTEIEDNIPAFLTLASMAFTFNIAHGIALGIIAHNLIYLCSSRREELTLSSMVLTVILGIYLAVYL